MYKRHLFLSAKSIQPRVVCTGDSHGVCKAIVLDADVNSTHGQVCSSCL